MVTREEPSLETLWLQNTETMDKVQRIYRSKLHSGINSNASKKYIFNLYEILSVLTVKGSNDGALHSGNSPFYRTQQSRHFHLKMGAEPAPET
jgi:hypothetical protein